MANILFKRMDNCVEIEVWPDGVVEITAESGLGREWTEERAQITLTKRQSAEFLEWVAKQYLEHKESEE